MTFAQSIDRAAQAERLCVRLGATRKALLASQRRLPRSSAGWKAMDAIVHDIDALLPLVATVAARSTPLNLNADSESPFKARATAPRIGEFHRWKMKTGATMDDTLETFAARMRKKGRIGKYDVQALRRDILKDGVSSRAEADLLIALDREVASVHFSWSAFFIATLTEFAVWRSGRPGYIDQDKANWLLGAVAGEGATHRATRALAQIAREAECFDEAFFAGSRLAQPEEPSRDIQEFALAA